MKNLFVRFVKDNSGATAIEYGLIAAGISVARLRPRAEAFCFWVTAGRTH
jgi:hypothetical protein